MKALSVQQPWAGLIAAGHKTVENRDWWTGYRGPLAIHASARPDTGAQLARIADVADVTIDDVKRMAEPQGCILAVAELLLVCRGRGQICECGPWAVPGLNHWHIANVRPLATPIPARGSLGLWEFPQDS